MEEESYKNHTSQKYGHQISFHIFKSSRAIVGQRKIIDESDTLFRCT